MCDKKQLQAEMVWMGMSSTVFRHLNVVFSRGRCFGGGLGGADLMEEVPYRAYF